jgi:hypothetical protein
VKYKLDTLEAMARAGREMWRDANGLREDTADWDEICRGEYASLMWEAAAIMEALIEAHPEVAQYVMEAPP